MYTDFSDNSDVLITMSGNRLECVACSLSGGSFYAYTTDSMCFHLQKHTENGDRIPEDLEDKLWSDDDTNFPYT